MGVTTHRRAELKMAFCGRRSSTHSTRLVDAMTIEADLLPPTQQEMHLAWLTAKVHVVLQVSSKQP